jgi:thiamine biosynthesis lipoprotein
MSVDSLSRHRLPERRGWVEHIMGMPMSIHLKGDDVRGPDAAEAVSAAYGSLREMDHIFSTYRADSEVMRLRREEVTLDGCVPLVAEAWRLGEEAHRLTVGAFTTLLPVGEGDLAFDPTGLVKGWAVDRAAATLAQLPDTSFCINAGGDLLVGAHPDLPTEGVGAISWTVGIEDPRDRTLLARTIELTRGAVATSGTAARGAHLYDPIAGEMVGRSGSVTVIGPSLLWADIWATALFVGGAVAQEAFARSAPAYRAFSL